MQIHGSNIMFKLLTTYCNISMFNDTASISRHGSVHQSCEQAVIAAEIRFVDGCDKANDIAYCH